MSDSGVAGLDIAALCEKCFPNWTAAVLNDLRGGRSDARVLLIDFAPKKHKNADDGLRSGQYVLKVQPAQTWPGEQPESVRHATAVARDATFAREHIPRLAYSSTIDNILVLLYEIAGQSLSSFVAADSVDAGSLRSYCALVARDLLEQWNRGYEIDNATTAAATLRNWLGYRLEPDKAADMHGYIQAETAGQAIFLLSGRVLVNPMWLATTSSAETPSATVAFNGLNHSDLHPGNILVNRTGQSGEPYWLIDFALSKEGPIGFDLGYLELALLLGHLQGAEPQRILTILEALEATDGTADASRVPVPDLGALECVRAIRRSIRAWQALREPLREDSINAQLLLSRVASGINWINKPIPTAARRLALAYSGWAAKQYLARFNVAKLNLLLEAKPADAPAPVKAAPVSGAWPEIWEQLHRFDPTRAKYILLTGPVKATPALESLAMLPWSAIIDLDPTSNESGLHSAISGSLSRLRSVAQFGREILPVDFDRGTAWMMANGWPTRQEPVPVDYRRWRQSYGESIRSLCAEIYHSASPLPVKVVLLASQELGGKYVQSLIDVVDEALKDSSDITLIGDTPLSDDAAVKAHYEIGVDDFLEALYHVYGGGSNVEEPTIPGAQGPAVVPLNQLRGLEEDLTLLHSNILRDLSVAEAGDDAFWRGNPPTWMDLHANSDVPRELSPALATDIKRLLGSGRNQTIELHHTPGSGGTTIALRCAWNLHLETPVLLLRRFSRNTADRIDQVFRLSQKPVLIVAEAALLPRTSREDLFRELAGRNVRCVILYVVRAFSDGKDKSSSRVPVADPLEDREAGAFLEAFSARTPNPKRVRRLQDLSTRDEWKPYRNPFFYGLTAYEKEFESVGRYVEGHLEGSGYAVQKVVRFLALATRYTQTGLSLGVVNRLLGLDADTDIPLTESVGESVNRLIVRRGQTIRLLHPVLAEEALRQLLGGRADWKHGLKDLSLDFINELIRILGPDADETRQLFEDLFIRRDYWNPARGRRNFAELILAIPPKPGQHQVLQALTDACPDEAHFWNHLGRHHYYEMKADFAVAEEYLKKAVELDPTDQVHHHSLGMVQRFWIRSLLAGLVKTGAATAESMFETIKELLAAAADEFGTARRIAPEDDHGYITHIQMIVEVAERLIGADASGKLPAVLSKRHEVGAWMRQAMVLAEDLLEHVRHLREQQPPSRFELNCITGLAGIYGHFDAVIGSLEQMANQLDDPDIRRALATAYHARGGRVWGKVPPGELRQIRTLMEDNLRVDPTNEHDIRTWFQAFRRLPDFSYVEGLDRLEAWSNRSGAVDAYYYLYILHFLRWRDGSERGEDAILDNIEKCRPRAVGRRGRSYEWLGREPQWCPLVHVSDLGEWRKDLDFFENPAPLEWATGSIESIKGLQAGRIRLGATVFAFFVPGTKFSPSRHLNSLVKFHLGFSYDGLRAWSVDFATETIGVRIPVAAEPRPRPTDAAPATGPVTDVRALRSRLVRFVSDQVTNADNLSTRLHLADLANRLLDQFGAPPVHQSLGYTRLVDLLKSIPEVEVLVENKIHYVAKRRNMNPVVVSTPGARPGQLLTGEALHSAVVKTIIESLEASDRQGVPTYLANLGSDLSRLYGEPPVYRRLKFAKLRHLVESIKGVVVDKDGLTASYVRKT